MSDGWKPALGNVMFTDDIERMPPEHVWQDQHLIFRDNNGQRFDGWVWLGVDETWYGQRQNAKGPAE